MTPPQQFPLPQTAPADSVQADTAGAVSRLGAEVNEVARLILSGQWDAVWFRIQAGAIDLVTDFVPHLIQALLVLLILYAIYRVLRAGLHRLLHRSKHVETGLQNLLMKTYRVVGLLFVAVIVLDQLGFNVAALLAGLGIAGIAVGFAARDTLENFISGITILIDRPFRVSDNIEVDDTFGTVEEITLRSTRIRTLNNQIAVMPNSSMITQKLVNHTMLSVLRIIVPFGIAYKEYPQQAREVVLALTEDDDRLHPDHKPAVVVTGLNDSSVDMELRLYLRNPKLEMPVRFDYIEKVREALREADIEIPFPHRQLFVDEAAAFNDSFLMQPQLPIAQQNGEGERARGEASDEER